MGVIKIPSYNLDEQKKTIWSIWGYYKHNPSWHLLYFQDCMQLASSERKELEKSEKCKYVDRFFYTHPSYARYFCLSYLLAAYLGVEAVRLAVTSKSAISMVL